MNITPQFFAQLFGIVLVVLSLGILFNFDNSRQLVREMAESATARYLSGVFPLFFGLWMIISICGHCVITGWGDWVVLVVAIILLLAGVFRLLFVDWWVSILRRYVDKAPIFAGLFGLILGLLLVYIGYVRPYFLG